MDDDERRVWTPFSGRTEPMEHAIVAGISYADALLTVYAPSGHERAEMLRSEDQRRGKRFFYPRAVRVGP